MVAFLFNIINHYACLILHMEDPRFSKACAAG